RQEGGGGLRLGIRPGGLLLLLAAAAVVVILGGQTEVLVLLVAQVLFQGLQLLQQGIGGLGLLLLGLDGLLGLVSGLRSGGLFLFHVLLVLLAHGMSSSPISRRPCPGAAPPGRTAGRDPPPGRTGVRLSWHSPCG